MSTMKDVAQRAQVSLSTVSYVLSGVRPVSDDTRNKVFRAMEDLGYFPHALARGLASRKSHIIALLCSPRERGIGITEMEFLNTMAKAARDLGYHLVLWSIDPDDTEGLRGLINQGLIDGAILMEVMLNDKRIPIFEEMRVPFSLIGRPEHTGGLYCVDIDTDKAMQEALSHLADLGHRNVFFVNQSEELYQAGYGPSVRAKEAFHLHLGDRSLTGHSYFCHAAPHAGRAVLDLALERDREASAMVIMNDRAVPGILQSLAAKGMAVPRDFSIVSILSSAKATELFTPPLTTWDPDSEELGKLGVKLLVDRLDGNARVPAKILVPCRQCIRLSTGPLAGADVKDMAAGAHTNSAQPVIPTDALGHQESPNSSSS